MFSYGPLLNLIWRAQEGIVALVDLMSMLCWVDSIFGLNIIPSDICDKL